MVGYLYQNLLDYWDNLGIWTGPSSCVYMGSTWTQRLVNDPAQPGLLGPWGVISSSQSGSPRTYFGSRAT